nr:SDR family oxidoreductase [Streptomyces sp. CBMA370]
MLARDLAPNKIRVNAVRPGTVRTELWEGLLPEPEAYFQSQGRELPAGQVGQPEGAAVACLFLLDNPFATGETLPALGPAELPDRIGRLEPTVPAPAQRRPAALPGAAPPFAGRSKWRQPHRSPTEAGSRKLEGGVRNPEGGRSGKCYGRSRSSSVKSWSQSR